MSFELERGEPVAEGIRRIASEQIDAALREIAAGDPGDPETVHAFRKRCKKIRGLLRLARGPLVAEDIYRSENGAFRDAARALAAARDADVLLATYDALAAWSNGAMDRRATAPIRARLTAERDRLHAALDAGLPGKLDEATRFLQRARQRVASWQIDAAGFSAIRPGLHATYRAAWRAHRASLALPAAEHLHEWRKHVKYHRSHLRLLRRTTAPSTAARCTPAETLGELLGDDHDLAVLRRRVSLDNATFGGIAARWPFVSLIDRRRAGLQREAFGLGERLFAEKPKAFVRRVGKQWKGEKG
jgi:CHAD domain-containing protein